MSIGTGHAGLGDHARMIRGEPVNRRIAASARSEEREREDEVVGRLLEMLTHRGDTNPALAEAWEEFRRIFEPLVRDRMRRIRIPRAEFADELQESWQAILIKLPEFHYEPGRGHFRAWLIVVIDHSLEDRARTRLRRATERLGQETESRLLGREPDPAAVVERQSERETLERLLAALPQDTPLSFDVCRMHWLEDRGLSEIAARLGITLSSVKSRIQWVRRKLHEQRARHANKFGS